MNDTSSGSLGTLIDNLYSLRAERLEREKSVREMKSQESLLTDQIMEQMKEVDTTRAGGELANVSINPLTVAHVSNWEQFHAFIAKTGYFHLLQKRVSDPAYRELLEKEITVPGVEPTVLSKLSLTKVSK